MRPGRVRRPRRARRSWRRGRSAEQPFDPLEPTGQRFRLRRRKSLEETSEAAAEQFPRRAQHLFAPRAEGEGVAAAVAGLAKPLEQPCLFEPGKQLGNRRRGHRSAAGEVGADDVILGDRLQDGVLGRGQRRVVSREEAFHPSARQRGDPRQRLRGLFLRVACTARTRHIVNKTKLFRELVDGRTRGRRSERRQQPACVHDAFGTRSCAPTRPPPRAGPRPQPGRHRLALGLPVAPGGEGRRSPALDPDLLPRRTGAGARLARRGSRGSSSVISPRVPRQAFSRTGLY